MAKIDEEDAVVGFIASAAAESAADNIRRYLDMHGDTPNGPVKVVNRVMKIAQALDESQRDAVLANVRSAIQSLREYEKKLGG